MEIDKQNIIKSSIGKHNIIGCLMSNGVVRYFIMLDDESVWELSHMTKEEQEVLKEVYNK